MHHILFIRGNVVSYAYKMTNTLLCTTTKYSFILIIIRMACSVPVIIKLTLF